MVSSTFLQYLWPDGLPPDHPLLQVDYDTYLTSRLDGVALSDAFEGIGNLFESPQAFDILLQVLTRAPGRAPEMASAASTITASIVS